jgi:hypothetical protein
MVKFGRAEEKRAIYKKRQKAFSFQKRLACISSPGVSAGFRRRMKSAQITAEALPDGRATDTDCRFLRYLMK